MDILAMLTLLIHNMRYFPIYLCLLQFISSMLQFSVYRSLTLDKLFLIILLFLLFFRGFLFLYFFFRQLILVYRNITDFCMLHSYPEISQNPFIMSNNFEGNLRIFYVQGHVISKQKQFHFFLSILDVFYFFFLSNYSNQDFQYYVELRV